MVGGAPHAHDRSLLRRRSYHQRDPERPRARRRLHERRELPRHRRPRIDNGFRRPDLFDRLACRLARRAVSRRRAAAQSGEIHLCRCRRDAPAADSGAAGSRPRHALDGDLLSHRADRRRGQPDQAHVRARLQHGRCDRRRGDGGVRAVWRNARDHLGTDREGGAAALRCRVARLHGPRALQHESARALRRRE